MFCDLRVNGVKGLKGVEDSWDGRGLFPRCPFSVFVVVK